MALSAEKIEKPQKKFVFKKWMAVVLAGLLATAAVFIVLGCIPYKGLGAEEFSDYLHVNIYDQSGFAVTVKNKATASDMTEADLKREELFNEGLASTGYSLLRAAFEFSYITSLRFETERISENVRQYNDDDTPRKNRHGEDVFKTEKRTERVMQNAKELLDPPETGGGYYALDFIYRDHRDQPRKTITVQGETIEYDRIRIVLFDSLNTIMPFTINFFDSNKVAHDAGETLEVEVPNVVIRLNTSKLYETLGEIKSLTGGSPDNGSF
ncbi:MAG: hypothetical protein FWH03_03135 [Firmicutes bacterium]|nr:hypothetical protein [Bacillota bacterium]